MNHWFGANQYGAQMFRKKASFNSWQICNKCRTIQKLMPLEALVAAQRESKIQILQKLFKMIRILMKKAQRMKSFMKALKRMEPKILKRIFKNTAIILIDNK